MELVHDGQETEAELHNAFLQKVMDNDHIIKKWFWVSTPVPVVTTLLLYLLVVLKVGPWYMEGRRPYQLTALMRLYNVFQVIHNGIMVFSLAVYPGVVPMLIKSSCNVIDDSYYSDLKSAYLFYSWNYFLSKLLDLIDTVFMVLRKKDSHITFLHVYHHAAMVFFVWFTFTQTKSHHAIIPGLLNAFVHMFMYFYYLLATFPQLKRYLWWKKHLTKLQLLQFGLILGYISLLYYNRCPISPTFTYIWLSNVFVILILFVNFYVKSYIVRPIKAQKVAQNGHQKTH